MITKQNLEIPLACGTTMAPITVRSPHHVEAIFLEFGHPCWALKFQAILTADEVRALVRNLELALANCKSQPIPAEPHPGTVDGAKFCEMLEQAKIPAEVAA